MSEVIKTEPYSWRDYLEPEVAKHMPTSALIAALFDDDYLIDLLKTADDYRNVTRGDLGKIYDLFTDELDARIPIRGEMTVLVDAMKAASRLAR